MAYQACCGKNLCAGCIRANSDYQRTANTTENNCRLCPFCRAPAPTSVGEAIKRMDKRIDSDDAVAIYCRGGYYYDGLIKPRLERVGLGPRLGLGPRAATGGSHVSSQISGYQGHNTKNNIWD